MKKTFTILAIFLSVLVVFSSCASKRLTKKALKLEALGQYSESADLFYQAVTIKKTNLEAYAGLKRTGQMTLSKKLTEFNKAYNEQKNKEAVYFYKDARAYFDKLALVDVDLNFPTFYDEYYNEVKDIYLEDKYYEGTTALDAEKFADAERIFKEIVALQENYKDSKEKLNTAIYEPKYREALTMMDNGRYRQAYYAFENIIKGSGSYKSSYDLKKECLTKGSVTISIAKIKNLSTTTGIESTLESKIISDIQAFNNPFIKLIDSQTSGKSVTPIVAPNSGQAKQTAPNYVLYCEISKFVYNKGSQEEIDKRGYLRKKVKVLNRETQEYEYKTEYDKINYKEYKMSRNIDMTFTFKLVNERTGEILSSSSKSLTTKDEIYYAKYSGDVNNLVPGYWKDPKTASPDDYINDNANAIKDLTTLLNARSMIKDYPSMSTEIIDSSASVVAKAVNDFVTEN